MATTQHESIFDYAINNKHRIKATDQKLLELENENEVIKSIEQLACAKLFYRIVLKSNERSKTPRSTCRN